MIRWNLRKERRQNLFFGTILMVSALVLNISFTLLFQMDKTYDRKFDELNTSSVSFMSTDDSLENSLKKLKNVTDVQKKKGIFAYSTMRHFHESDMSINSVFYKMNDQRNINQFEILEEKKSVENPIYIPYFVSEFGEYSLGSKITFEIDEKSYTFHVAGIIEEMQFGNAGSGVLGFYLPAKEFNQFSENLTGHIIIEYSLTSSQPIREEVLDYLSEKKIVPVSIVDAKSTKATRTMVSSLLEAILFALAVLIMIISLLLCLFRIRSFLDDEKAAMSILKASGYKGKKILFNTVVPYLMVAGIASLIGIGLSNILIEGAASLLSLQSGLRFVPHFDWMAALITICLILFMTFIFSYQGAKKILKLDPVKAINDQNEVKKSRKAPQFILLALLFFLIGGIVLFASNLLDNGVFHSERFASAISDEVPDLIIKGNQSRIDSIEKELDDNSKVNFTNRYSVYDVKADGQTIKAFVSSDFSKTNHNLCYEGHNPETDNEVALGSAFSDRYEIGDTIQIEYDNHQTTYEICGFIQSLNNSGEVVELSLKSFEKLNPNKPGLDLYVYLKDGVNPNAFFEDLSKKEEDQSVSLINSYKMQKETEKIFENSIQAAALLVFALSALISVLVLSFLIQSQMLKQRKEYGILKILGYTNRQLIRQIGKDILVPAYIGLIAAAILSFLYLPAINRIIFESMGAYKNELAVSFGMVSLTTLILMIVCVLIVWILARSIRKVSCISLVQDDM